MRGAGWLVAALLAIGWIASQLPEPLPSQDPGSLSTWRLTRDGWEQASWLAGEAPIHRPSLHPGVVGLLQLLLAITGLAAFPASSAKPTNARRSRRMTILAPRRSESPTPDFDVAGPSRTAQNSTH